MTLSAVVSPIPAHSLLLFLLQVSLLLLLAILLGRLAARVGLPAIVAIIAAILVLLAGIPTGGYGLGGRFGSGRHRA